MKCDEIQEMIPPYVLGSLGRRDRARVEAHLVGCDQCRQELEESLEAIGRLAAFAPQEEPSPQVKERLLSRIREADQRPPRVPLFTFTSRWRLAAAGSLAILVPALLATTIFLNTRIGDMHTQMDEIELMAHTQEERSSELALALQQQRGLAYMLASATTGAFSAEKAPGDPMALGMVMTSPDETWGLLISSDLESLPPDLAYQVWFLTNGQRIGGDVFTTDQSGWSQVSLRPPQPLSQFQSVGVTIEPQEGSPEPTSPNVMLVRMDRDR